MTGWVDWWVDERAGEWAGGWKGGWLETASQHSNVRFALYSTICIAIAVRACTATMHPIHVVVSVWWNGMETTCVSVIARYAKRCAHVWLVQDQFESYGVCLTLPLCLHEKAQILMARKTS